MATLFYACLRFYLYFFIIYLVFICYYCGSSEMADRTCRKWDRGERKCGGGWRIFSHFFFFFLLFFSEPLFFCASNILLTAAGSDPGIMCQYISRSGPLPTQPPCLPPPPTSTLAHIHKHTHIYAFHSKWTPPPSTEVNYQNCVWKWMKADCRSLSPFSLLTRPFPCFDISGFFFSLSLVFFLSFLFSFSLFSPPLSPPHSPPSLG